MTTLTSDLLALGQPIVLDISHHQHNYDAEAVASAGISGVVHKASQGSRYRSNPPLVFAARALTTTAAGLAYGSYHFADLRSRSGNPKQQADYYASKLAAVDDSITPCLDFEQNSKYSDIRKLGKRKAARWVNVFVDEFLTVTGHQQMLLYGSPNDLGLIDIAQLDWKHLDLWLASWATSTDGMADTARVVRYRGDVQAAARSHIKRLDLPDPVLWQFSASGDIPSIEGRCDTNIVCDPAWWAACRPDPTPSTRPEPSATPFDADLAEAERLGLTDGIRLTPTTKAAAVMAVRARRL